MNIRELMQKQHPEEDFNIRPCYTQTSSCQAVPFRFTLISLLKDVIGPPLTNAKGDGTIFKDI